MERAACRRHDDVVGRELHAGGAEEGADGAGVGADLLAAAVDHHRDLGTRRGRGPLGDPGAAESGEHHEDGDPEHPGSREEAGAAPADRCGAGGRPLFEEVGDRRELLGAGERQPGGGVVGFGPGRRRRRARLGHRQQRLRLGHHRGLVLGVGLEELVGRREVVEVVGEREPGGRVVGLGPRGRGRHRGFEGRQVDLGRDLGGGVLHAEDLVGGVGGASDAVVGARGEGLAERLVEAGVEVDVDADVVVVVQAALVLLLPRLPVACLPVPRLPVARALGARLLEEHLDRRQPVGIGDRQPRRRVVRCRARATVRCSLRRPRAGQTGDVMRSNVPPGLGRADVAAAR